MDYKSDKIYKKMLKFMKDGATKKFVEFPVPDFFDINSVNTKGNTLLFQSIRYACRHGNCDIVKTLLCRDDVDVDIPDRQNTTPLGLACSYRLCEVIELIMQKQKEEYDKMESRNLSLVSAAGLGHVDVMKILLENGADVNYERESGCTPLAAAAFYQNIDAVKFLLDNDAILNVDAMLASKDQTIVDMIDSYRKNPKSRRR